jgi:hypothetical protein
MFICSPVTEKPLEQILSEIDYSTPPNMIYEDIVPLEIKATWCGVDARIRDYHNPVMYLASNGGTVCETSGLLVLAEPMTDPECYRYVILPLEDDHPCIITRNVNPTKIYCDLSTTINSDASLSLCSGAAYEPALADVINIIDNCTNATENPSPPLGWWDKLRLVLHGRNQIIASGNSSIRFRALGSMDPYFDPEHSYGVEGAELVFSNGVEITIGGSIIGVSIVCGELKLNMPKSCVESGEENELCFAKLNGGVKMIVEADFFVSQNGKIEHSKLQHHDVHLLAIDSLKVQRQDFSLVDSFDGFRSHSLKLNINVTSPRENFADLPFPQNVLFINDKTMDVLEQINKIYQNLLTNVPIKRGALFNEAVTFKKPKLGRTVTAVQLQTVFQPVVFSFTLECDDTRDHLGFRLRAKQMTLDMLFKQYEVKTQAQQQQLEKRAVTKWIRVQNLVSFVEFEGRVLSCSTDRDFAIANSLDNSEWIFKEDYDIDLEKIGLLPCVWAPRLDFLRQEPSQQNHETELESTRHVYAVQSRILKLRLREVESQISKTKQRIHVLSSRTKIFFEEANEKSQEEISNLEILEKDLRAKSAVIIKELEQCHRIMSHGGIRVLK